MAAQFTFVNLYRSVVGAVFLTVNLPNHTHFVFFVVVVDVGAVVVVVLLWTCIFQQMAHRLVATDASLAHPQKNFGS